MLSFRLNDVFIDGYKERDPGFGFNGLGLLTYYRTYSRLKENGLKEEWYETVRRVVEGAYSLQRNNALSNNLSWSDEKAQRSAQEMYERIFTMKFMPPGRMLWALGTTIVHDKQVGQAIFNCAFVSTTLLGTNLEESIKPFKFMMDMSMSGVGVGFDVNGAGKITVHRPSGPAELFLIPDSREGWVQSLEKLLYSYFEGNFGSRDSHVVTFDYSHIRPAGLAIHGFGGISSGPEPLIHLHEQLIRLLDNSDGKAITVTAIADIMNMIGQCVVAGNVRRTAQIALGPVDSREYRSLKDYRWNSVLNVYEGKMAHRAAWGWASNNSVIVDSNTDFTEVADQTAVNGEPGYVFMDNVRAYSRLCDPPDNKDEKAMGTNPCGEQTLESYELCCLIETFPSRAESKEDYLRTLKFAYLLGKTATLVDTTWEETNMVQKRNRRIGTSVSGITNFLNRHSREILQSWLEAGYREIQKWDDVYSSWLSVPRSIKTTSVKPSGTVSLLAGVNPGCHYPEHEYYIRRVRIAKNSTLVPSIRKSGLVLEDDVIDPTSYVVAFPVHTEGKTLKEVTIWDQAELAVFLQRFWSDNQVSCTVSFTSDEGKEIKEVLEQYKHQLKSISFLPRLESGAYAQMPYEAISKERFESMMKTVRPIDFRQYNEESAGEIFCNNDGCTL